MTERSRHRHHIHVLDRWVVILAAIAFTAAEVFTNVDFGDVLLVTAGGAAAGITIGLVLVNRLREHRDAWMARVR